MYRTVNKFIVQVVTIAAIIAWVIFLAIPDADATETKEMYVQYSNETNLVITNEECQLAKAENMKLYASYAVDIKTGKTLEEGCWYHDQEIIHVIFPPSSEREALDFPIPANLFQQKATM